MLLNNKYIIYVLHCKDGPLYTGIINNIQCRLEEHIDGMEPKCYTYTRQPVELVFTCKFDEALEAIAIEKQIKGWSRKRKRALIDEKLDLLPYLSSSSYAKRIDEIASRNGSNHRFIMCHSSTSSE